MKAERWPLDFEALQRGDIIPADDAEKAVLMQRDDKGYWAKLLKLRDDIIDHFRIQRGDEVAVRIHQDGLRILTHPEQAEYAPQLQRRGYRLFAQAAIKGGGVDMSKLTDDARARHERFLHVNSFRLQQLRKAPPPRLEG